jgi:DNA-binding MarR family transcriptional regulator
MADTSSIEDKIGLLIWKASNFWLSKLRKILVPYNLSINEYFILHSIKLLSVKNSNIYQNEISKFIGTDISVTSVTLKLLEKKKFISRDIKSDNRKKIINILHEGDIIFKILHPLIEKEEETLFNKLKNETFNFTNSLKLLLGKKIRIKADKIYRL